MRNSILLMILCLNIISCTTTKHNLAKRGLATEYAHTYVTGELTIEQARTLWFYMKDGRERLRQRINELGPEVLSKTFPKGFLKGYTGLTLIHASTLEGKSDVVRMLVRDFKVDPDIQVREIGGPMHLAAIKTNVPMIHTLHSVGANIDARSPGPSGVTALYIAADGGDVFVIEGEAKDIGESINKAKTRTVKTLLDLGADPRIRTGLKGSALKTAQWHSRVINNAETLELLENKVIELESRNGCY